MRVKFARAGVLLLACALAAGAGCGGGVALSDPTRINGTLEASDARFSDGSLADFYIATAQRTGRAQVDLTSAAFDAFLIISVLNSDGEVENIVEDDDSGDGRNARVIFDVEKGKRYFIAAVDDGAAAAPGSYSIVFSDILGNARVNPDANP